MASRGTSSPRFCGDVTDGPVTRNPNACGTRSCGLPHPPKNEAGFQGVPTRHGTVMHDGSVNHPVSAPADPDVKVTNGDLNSDVSNAKAAPAGTLPAAPARREPGPDVAGEQPCSAGSRPARETFAGYGVHPFASQFPLIEGAEFDELVESIQSTGAIVPVEIHDGQLIDGRNRARAVEELRRRGLVVELPTVEWRPHGFETVEEHIYALNVHRRHLTDDQRAAFATSMLPGIRAAREARQAETRFSGGNTAAVKTTPPDGPEAQPRSSHMKGAASSVGQLAAIAKVSMHKAGQAIALADAVKAGTIQPKELEAVQRGSKRLREVAPNRRKPRRSPSTPPTVTRTSADESGFWFDRDSRRGTGDADGACSTDPTAPEVTEEEILKRWERFKSPFAVADHRELRRLTTKIIAAEQRHYDRVT